MQFIDIYIICYDGVRKRVACSSMLIFLDFCSVCMCVCVRAHAFVCLRLAFCAQCCLCLLSCPFFIAPSVFSNVYCKSENVVSTVFVCNVIPLLHYTRMIDE